MMAPEKGMFQVGNIILAIIPAINGIHLRMAAETWDPFYTITGGHVYLMSAIFHTSSPFCHGHTHTTYHRCSMLFGYLYETSYYMPPSENNGEFHYSGVMEKVMKYLRIGLNISTTIVRPPDGSWGILDVETGKWGGMVGMVHRNEVDFALGEFKEFSD